MRKVGNRIINSDSLYAFYRYLAEADKKNYNKPGNKGGEI